MIQQRNLILRFDDPRLRHEPLAIDNLDAFTLQREQNGQLNNVDADGLFVQTAHFELDSDFPCDIFGAAHFRGHCAS